jgi:hypothetical protein
VAAVVEVAAEVAAVVVVVVVAVADDDSPVKSQAVVSDDFWQYRLAHSETRTSIHVTHQKPLSTTKKRIICKSRNIHLHDAVYLLCST